MEAGSPGRWQRNRIIESNLKRRFSLVPLFTLKMRVTKERNPWPQASKGGFLHGPSHKKRTTADLIRSATLFYLIWWPVAQQQNDILKSLLLLFCRTLPPLPSRYSFCSVVLSVCVINCACYQYPCTISPYLNWVIRESAVFLKSVVSDILRLSLVTQVHMWKRRFNT